MKRFLAKKWLGPLFLFLYTLGMSLFFTNQIFPHLKEAFPVIHKEASNFLPITVQNGEITQPQNTIISKSYSDESGKNFNVVLDTRSDTLDIRTLTEEGIYLSKKCVYVVSDKESKVKCLESNQSSPALTITNEMFKNFLNKVEKYAKTFLICAFTIVLFLGFYFVILFYTAIMHWIIALLFKTSFGQTLFVNTLAYMGMNCLEVITPINITFLIKIILFVCINLFICKTANERKIKET